MASSSDPLQMPALPPPPGETSNLVDPINTFHTAAIATLVICLIPPTLFVPVRLYVRTRILQTFQLVDVCCILAYVFFVGLVGLSLSLLNYGEGNHAYDITLATFIGYLRQANFTEIVYMPAILFTKLVILLQLLQVFVVGKNNFRYYFLHTLIWLNTIFFTILLFLEIFQCWPRVKIWNALAEGHCINISVTFVATAAINVASDVSILTMPIFWVSKLNMRWKKKVGMVLIFGTGVFACIASIMRVVVSVQDIDSLDVTFTLGAVNLWSVAEISAGQILACVPFLPRLFTSSNNSKNSNNKKGSSYWNKHSGGGGTSNGTVMTTTAGGVAGTSTNNTLIGHHPSSSTRRHSRKEYLEMDHLDLVGLGGGGDEESSLTIPERAMVMKAKPVRRPVDLDDELDDIDVDDVESQVTLAPLRGE